VMAYVWLDYTIYIYICIYICIYIYIYIFRCLSFLLRKEPLVKEKAHFTPLETILHRARTELYHGMYYKLELVLVLKGAVTLEST
jgi:hypothetical protein